MSERTDKDLERSAEEALDRLYRGWEPLSSETRSSDIAGGDDEAEVVAHLEALSLLAYAVPVAATSAELRVGLLRAVAAEPRGPRNAIPFPPTAAVDSPGPPSATDPVDVTLHHRILDDPGDMTLVGLGPGGSSPASDLSRGFQSGDVRDFGVVQDFGGATVRRDFTAPPRPANSNSALYLLAACLVFCLVGLGYLYGQLQAQDAQSITRQAQLEAQAERARQEAEEMRARVQMVTDVARVAYPMQGVTTNGGMVHTVGRPEPGEVRPDGIVYVCGQHQRWYLSLSGFEPAPSGKVYHLWFKTDRGVIDAGPIELSADGRADVGDLSMPKGTQGFLVSLEDAAESGSAEPHGRIILKGEQPVQL